MTTLQHYVKFQLASVAYWERVTAATPYPDNPYTRPFIRGRFPIGYFPQQYPREYEPGEDYDTGIVGRGDFRRYYRSTFFHPLRRAVWIAQGRRKHGIPEAHNFQTR